MSDLKLPPFPVDDASLSMLEAAMDPWSHGDPEAPKSSLWTFLELMSEMVGSDPRAVEEVIEEASEIDGRGGTYIMRDPIYTDHCVIKALIDEVRRLRGAV